jgi:hypothetical protein
MNSVCLVQDLTTTSDKSLPPAVSEAALPPTVEAVLPPSATAGPDSIPHLGVHLLGSVDVEPVLASVRIAF